MLSVVLTLSLRAQLHAKFEDAAYAYLCTELCSGGDLERLVEEEGPLPEAAVARLLLEILQVCVPSGDWLYAVYC